MGINWLRNEPSMAFFRAKSSLTWLSKPVKAYSKRPFKAYLDLVGAEEGGGRKGLLDQMLLLEVAHRLQVPLLRVVHLGRSICHAISGRGD